MGNLKPTRDAATEDDVICDLDLVTSQRVTFQLKGKTHVVVPINTQVFFEFWKQVLAFKNGNQDDAEKSNEEYFKTIKIVCKDITKSDVEKMTVYQKVLLMEALCAKIVGNKKVWEDAQKKKPVIQENSPESPLLN